LIDTLPEYWVADVSAGLERGGWAFMLFVDNVFDESGISGRYSECAILTCMAAPGDALEGDYYDVLVRPLTGGIRIGSATDKA
jgi:hypothetical protein